MRWPDLAAEHDNALACVRCGLCLDVCPTYQVTLREEESPRGRIAMARALIEGHLELTPDLAQHHRSCLLCEACTNVCPAGVKMEHLGVPLRQLVEKEQPKGARQRLLTRLGYTLFADMSRFRAIAGLLALYQKSGLQALVRALGILRLLGLARAEGFLPAVHDRFLVPNGQRWVLPNVQPRGEALLFAGCMMSTAFAETSRATARVLAAHGCGVTAPGGQGCCGALNVHGGDVDGARALARKNVDAFEEQPADWIVVNAAGCGSLLKEYGHLLADDPAYATRARAFAARVRDVSEVLAPLEPQVSLRPAAEPIRAAYQDPCHLAQAQRVVEPPRTVLRRVPGLQLAEIGDGKLCCGSAGVYNLTEPRMADQLQQRKVAAFQQTGAEVLVTANPGCHVQLADGLRRAGSKAEVRHVVDLLDDAFDYPPALRTVG